jgi:hypothetical protein
MVCVPRQSTPIKVSRDGVFDADKSPPQTSQISYQKVRACAGAMVKKNLFQIVRCKTSSDEQGGSPVFNKTLP